MHDCYVTTTLLNSWLYYLKSREDREEKAKTDFLNCLNKIKTEPTEDMQRGLNFEKTVYHCDINDAVCDDDNTVNEIKDYIKGGLWQLKVSKHVGIDGLDVLVFGYADVIKMDTVYDIKRVKTYKTGKYNYSVQHKLYLYCTGLPVFKYLVSDGENVFIEPYTPNKHLEAEVQALIIEFFKWLQNTGLFEIYLEKWKGEDKE